MARAINPTKSISIDIMKHSVAGKTCRPTIRMAIVPSLGWISRQQAAQSRGHIRPRLSSFIPTGTRLPKRRGSFSQTPPAKRVAW
jgi:hypothetical protein